MKPIKNIVLWLFDRKWREMKPTRILVWSGIATGIVGITLGNLGMSNYLVRQIPIDQKAETTRLTEANKIESSRFQAEKTLAKSRICSGLGFYFPFNIAEGSRMDGFPDGMIVIDRSGATAVVKDGILVDFARSGQPQTEPSENPKQSPENCRSIEPSPAQPD